MSVSRLFEEILNPSSNNDTDYLQWPLESENKPAMWLIENRLFEQILRETETTPALTDYADDIINTLNNLGKSPGANQKDIDYLRTEYSVCKITGLLKKLGITGTDVIITYDKIKEKHYEKGIKQGRANHVYTADFLKQVCQQLPNPVIVSKYVTSQTQGQNILSFYLNLKIDNNWALSGIQIDPKRSKITTIFGDDLKTKSGNDKKLQYVQYVDWGSSPNTDELINLIDVDTANPDIFK